VTSSDRAVTPVCRGGDGPSTWLNGVMKGLISPMRWVAMAVLAACAALGAGSVVFAHDEIESSVPEHKSQFDDPISEVLINFGAPVGGVELVLVGPDNVDLPGAVEMVSESQAKLLFEPLAVEGEYLVRYLAEEDGHLVAAAISFVYGDRAGSSADVFTWVLFGLAAALILAIGAFFSLKRARHGTLEDDPDPEPATV